MPKIEEEIELVLVVKVYVEKLLTKNFLSSFGFDISKLYPKSFDAVDIVMNNLLRIEWPIMSTRDVILMQNICVDAFSTHKTLIKVISTKFFRLKANKLILIEISAFDMKIIS